MNSDDALLLDHQALLIARMVLFTAVAAGADAMGFVHSARAWEGGGVHWDSLGRGGLFFVVGVLAYWLASRDLSALGVGTPEMQALFWFMMTVVGLAIVSGQFLNWPTIDKAIAAVVVSGLCTLIVRVG